MKNDSHATATAQKVQPDTPVKTARIAAGLSIKQLAEVLGAPYATIQKWNSGTSKPPVWMEKLVIKEIERYAAAKK
ncbi:MAG: helix-turn-helix transcriptional regulator [Selenomonadaceae bacterium]|nr:helix-turn-helix transcriptional regulator [Selenomonadaceae bacterium]